VIGHILVVDDDYDRPGVTEFPHVSVFVDLLPRESSIARDEDVGIGVSGQLLSYISDSEHELFCQLNH